MTVRTLDLKDAVAHTLQHMPGKLQSVNVNIFGFACIVLRDDRGDYVIDIAADTLEHVNARIRKCRQERK